MRKELQRLIVAICAIITIPLLSSCGKEDDEPAMKYHKATDWDIAMIESYDNSIVLQCNPYKSEWGIYYSTDKTKLSDFKYISQLEFNDWQKLEELNIGVVNVSYDTTRRLIVQDLFPNTTYYFIAFYYTFESIGGSFTSVNYTDILSFTTSEE